METRIEIPSPQHLHKAAQTCLRHIQNTNVIAFSGELGAGKTTFIKALCNELQVTSPVTSPSFSIINEYVTAHQKQVYHLDFYRITDISEVFDLGYEDYFYSDSYCFIEWPEKIEELLPEDTLYIKIHVNSTESRTLELSNFSE